MEQRVIKVNLQPKYSMPQAVNVSQYDVGVVLKFELYDGMSVADLTGCTAKIHGTRPSGVGFSVTGTISNNTVTVSTVTAMTGEYGRFPAEIELTKTGVVVGTANFVMAVEKSPHPDGTIDSDIIAQESLLERVEALEDDITDVKSDIGDLSELETEDKSSIVAAINEARGTGGSGGDGLTQTEKSLILELFSKAAYAEDDAGDTYDELEQLWTGYSITWRGSGYSKSNSAISASAGSSYTSTVTANTGFTLTDVTVTMGGTTVQGAWSEGTVTIPSVTGNVVITVTTSQITVSSISAVYTQSGTVYDTDTLDSLKNDLVVTATFMDSTTGVIADTDYTLSGTLAVGTSTITVSYGGQTDTFNVTVSAEDWTVVRTIGDNYETGLLSLTDGTVDTSSTSWYTSDFIEVPDGATSFARDTSRTSDFYLVWYDSAQAYLGNGLSSSLSGNSTYGGGYTDSNSVIWNVVPQGATYCKVSWRTSATYTSVTFARNKTINANTTPISGKLYVYTYDATDTGSYVPNDDYLKCEGMTYLQLRPVLRRSITFYDEEFIQVSQVATANNIGNNVEVPSGAVYFKCTNTNVAGSGASTVRIIGQRLVEFTDESLSSW